MTEKFALPRQRDRPEEEFEAMRSAVRFPLTLEVELRTEAGLTHAVTRDVSSNGIQFQMSYAPPIGSTLAWSMTLPGTTMGIPEDVRVACVGRVVWAAPNGNHVHVGAVIDEYVLKSEVE